MATQQNNGQEQDLNHLRKVRREKLAELQANGQNPFEITKYDVTHHSQEVKDNFDELEGKHVVLAGRMMSKRVMGKASFCNVQDLQGNIQSYVARDSIGEEEYKAFKKMDIGDIVGLEGEVFKTKTGEISIHASAVKLLSKSLQILPEKFHGLTNTDTRADLSTGMLSPVREDSLTALSPSTITPSTGMLSPGRTTKRSPLCTCSIGTVVS